MGTQGFQEQSYPSIPRRYIASVIDGLLIGSLFILTSFLFQQEQQMIRGVKLLAIFNLLCIYEPFCTSKFCTLGQKITGIRVRNYKTLEKIGIAQAYIRIITKILLGFISLVSILFSKDRRAIHDYAAGSIMVSVEN